ncbi:uncharacterized protein An17g00540, partial [Aspergillus niger]|uniref:THO complex subunit 2 N-terminal domain-containing protein n=2 Tax=Aspergillus niger TaxID=5061 RepID=A0AAJ8E129_ASPNG
MSPPSTTPAKDVSDQSQANGVPPTTDHQKPPPSPSPSSSQPQTHINPSPAPTPMPAPAPQAQASAPQPPPGPPPPYDYEYVTQNAIDEWATTGKKHLVERGIQVKDAQDAAALASIYQELIRSALYGRLSPEEAGAAVRDIIGEEVAAEDVDMQNEGQAQALLDTRSLFLDTLSILTDSDTSNSALRPLVFSTGINSALMRLQLDTQLLQSLGLVRETFTRMGIRKQTNLLYRQSNYNLLREESEGYSKLLTELFTTSNNEPPSSEVVEDTFERVKAMIGAFDMDVGRVLDVTLDVFAAVLVKQYRFFVKLLRASSWWPKEDAFRTVDAEEKEMRKWIEETGTLPPKGSRVAAQLLGFKLRFYSSRARAKSDVLPDNLIYLAALLIKVGFISLRDLYPHLWRPDDSMDALKEEKLKEKADRERAARPGGGINALMMAGALSDDTLPIPRIRESETRSATPGKDQETDKSTGAKTEEDELPEPSDQKVMLLKSLLAIGALPESLFILSKFPWLMDVYPELPEFIHRILHHCLGKVYSSLRPLPSVEVLKEQKQILNHDQSGVPKGQIRLAQAPPRRVLRWAQLDKEDTNDGTDYRFYWDDWADNVPICQTVDDVFALCSSFLNLSGHKIGQDP